MVSTKISSETVLVQLILWPADMLEDRKTAKSLIFTVCSHRAAVSPKTVIILCLLETKDHIIHSL